MTPIKINIHSRQSDGEIMNYKTNGELLEKSDKLQLEFSIKADPSLPPTKYKLIYWREGLAFLETTGNTNYRFRLEKGKSTKSDFFIDSLKAEVTVITDTVSLTNSSTHNALHMCYRLYTGQSLLNKTDITLSWDI